MVALFFCPDLQIAGTTRLAFQPGKCYYYLPPSRFHGRHGIAPGSPDSTETGTIIVASDPTPLGAFGFASPMLW